MSKTRKRSSPAANVIKMPPAKSAPITDHDEIARRAYEIFLARGAAHGSDMDDWLLAEHELRSAWMPEMKRAAGRKDD
jgi:Protein of unknown function (DUF2934)